MAKNIAPTAYKDDRALMSNRASLLDRARLEGYSFLGGGAVVRGWAALTGGAVVRGRATVEGSAVVRGRATVEGSAVVGGAAVVCDNAHVYGSARIIEGTIGRDADVSESAHCVSIRAPFPDRITVYRTKDGARVQAGCQNFSLDDSEEEMEALSRKHFFDLPVGWRIYLAAFRATASTWH